MQEQLYSIRKFFANLRVKKEKIRLKALKNSFYGQDKRVPESELNAPGLVKCMALVYEGKDAVRKIREVLGPTDPTKAPEGTVRREFGTDVMVNSAHASDSKESYERESKVIRIDENDLGSIIEDSLK